MAASLIVQTLFYLLRTQLLVAAIAQGAPSFLRHLPQTTLYLAILQEIYSHLLQTPYLVVAQATPSFLNRLPLTTLYLIKMSIWKIPSQNSQAKDYLIYIVNKQANKLQIFLVAQQLIQIYSLKKHLMHHYLAIQAAALLYFIQKSKM